jgi:hypothetical protein
VVPVDGIWLDDAWWYGGSPGTLHQRNLEHDRRVVVHLEDTMAAVILEGSMERVVPPAEQAGRLKAASKAKYGYGPARGGVRRRAVGAAPGAGEGLERVPDRRHPVPLGLAGTLGGPAGGQVAALAGLGAATHGYLFVVDRLKELIKYKGYQVAPAELEQLLCAHPAVADAAVVPRPDPLAGELPVAHVARRAEVSAAELEAWVADRVAPYKRLRGVQFVDQVPRSPTGKLLRRVLVEAERADAAGAA